MSTFKERAKMFSNNPGKEKDLKKALNQKEEKKERKE